MDGSLNIVCDPIWPWWQVIGAIVGLFVFVLATYPPRLRHLPALNRRLLLGFRLAAVVVLGLAMLRPALPIEEDDERRLVLLVIGDDSRSMQTLDGPGSISRRAAILKTLAEAEPQFEQLREKVEIRYFNFSEALTAAEELNNKTEGNMTLIGGMLKSLVEETEGSEEFLGVVVLSDGAQRAVPTNDLDPAAMAETFARSRQIPIYTIGVGSEEVVGATRDLSVEELLVSPQVFEKKEVPVTGKINIVGAAGRKLIVRLLVEDRSNAVPGTSGEMKLAPATGNAKTTMVVETKQNVDVVPVELSFIPQQAGSFKIALEVVPIEGELREGNNRRETIISVRKGGLNVVYFDTYRPEQKFVRHVNSAENIQLDYQPVRYGGQVESKIDPELFEKDRYDVYIIGDVPARIFGRDNLQKLQQRMDEGAGLLMTGGSNTFHAGFYRTNGFSPRGFPIRLDRPTTQVSEDTKMVPTSIGLSEYVMRLDTREKNKARWEKLPPMKGATVLIPRDNSVKPFAMGRTENGSSVPLLLASESGKTRMIVFGGDTTYLWFMRGFVEEHQRFWQQMIFWLAHKDEQGDQTVWTIVDPSNYTPDQDVGVKFGARNTEGEPILDASFTLNINAPDGTTETIKRQGPIAENLLEHSSTKLPGDHWVKVAAEKDGQSLGPEAWARFIVDDRDLEMDHPAANFQTLEDISATTGGSRLPPEELGDFLTGKLNDLEDLTHQTLDPLWDDWAFLLLFVSLMSLEWFFRKKRGLV